MHEKRRHLNAQQYSGRAVALNYADGRTFPRFCRHSNALAPRAELPNERDPLAWRNHRIPGRGCRGMASVASTGSETAVQVATQWSRCTMTGTKKQRAASAH